MRANMQIIRAYNKGLLDALMTTGSNKGLLDTLMTIDTQLEGIRVIHLANVSPTEP